MRLYHHFLSEHSIKSYLFYITRSINAHRGTINCSRVALQVNQFLSEGFDPYSPPVAPDKPDPDLIHWVDKRVGDEVRRAYTFDSRLCPPSTTGPMTTDLTETGLISPTEKKSEKIKYLRADKSILIDTLRCLPRNHEKVAYGYIIFVKKDGVSTHICNFFIDQFDAVYIIEAQFQPPMISHISKTGSPADIKVEAIHPEIATASGIFISVSSEKIPMVKSEFPLNTDQGYADIKKVRSRLAFLADKDEKEHFKELRAFCYGLEDINTVIDEDSGDTLLIWATKNNKRNTQYLLLHFDDLVLDRKNKFGKNAYNLRPNPNNMLMSYLTELLRSLLQLNSPAALLKLDHLLVGIGVVCQQPGWSAELRFPLLKAAKLTGYELTIDWREATPEMYVNLILNQILESALTVKDKNLRKALITELLKKEVDINYILPQMGEHPSCSFFGRILKETDDPVWLADITRIYPVDWKAKDSEFNTSIRASALRNPNLEVIKWLVAEFKRQDYDILTDMTEDYNTEALKSPCIVSGILGKKQPIVQQYLFQYAKQNPSAHHNALFIDCVIRAGFTGIAYFMYKNKIASPSCLLGSQMFNTLLFVHGEEKHCSWAQSLMTRLYRHAPPPLQLHTMMSAYIRSRSTQEEKQKAMILELCAQHPHLILAKDSKGQPIGDILFNDSDEKIIKKKEHTIGILIDLLKIIFEKAPSQQSVQDFSMLMDKMIDTNKWPEFYMRAMKNVYIPYEKNLEEKTTSGKKRKTPTPLRATSLLSQSTSLSLKAAPTQLSQSGKHEDKAKLPFTSSPLIQGYQ